MTRFICSAIAYIDSRGVLKEAYGERHSDCYAVIHERGDTKVALKTKTEGFMVEIDGIRMFVNRQNALPIAIELGYKIAHPEIGVMSEDLW